MTTALMVLMVFLLGYGIYFLCTHLEKEEKDAKKAAQKDESGWSEILPGYLGRTIEVVVKDPMFGIGVIHSCGIWTISGWKWYVKRKRRR